MELGLSLGDASRPFPFMEKTYEAANQLGLGFNTALSIGPIITTQGDQQEEHEEEEEEEEEEEAAPKQKLNNHNTTEDREATNENLSPSPKPNNSVLQLDLLPNTPVVAVIRPPPQLSLPWPPPSLENGSFSAEAAGASSRGLVVNRQLAAVDEVEERAALSSSPNSAASSFPTDLCIYSSRGGRGSISGSGNYYYNGSKRDSDGERASSRASDEDIENGGSTRKKLRLSKEQSAFLEDSFKEHNTLNPKQKLALAKQLNLRPRQVEVWFQNRRARTKLKQTEVDCEYLKRCCETLAEENRRLHKELQELRALKTSNPFDMQLPATTLTMCPSCERVATNSTSTSSATATTGAMAATAKTTNESTSKAIGFPPGKPRFYPFAHTQPHHHDQPTAS